MPLSCTPIPVTVVKIGEFMIVDPTFDEYKAADARLTITTIDSGEVCSLQKGGEMPLNLKEIDAMMDLAIKKGKEIRKIVEE